MDYVIYIMIAALLFIYAHVLITYIKTGKFKDKKDKYNIVGVIGYSTQTITVICVLLLFLFANKNKPTDTIIWLIVVFLLLTIFIYPSYFLFKNKPKKEKKIIKEEVNDEEKYGVLEYENYKLDSFRIPNNANIDDKFNTLISIITNDNISFVHPKKYKSILEVFKYLESEGYVKVLDGNHPLEVTLSSVSELFKKYGIKVVIKEEDITKEDKEYIQLRRKDSITTTVYDISKINEVLKKKKKTQKLIGVFIYENDNILYSYLCLVKEKTYKKFFETSINQK